jgi:hypothetical protein
VADKPPHTWGANTQPAQPALLKQEAEEFFS